LPGRYTRSVKRVLGVTLTIHSRSRNFFGRSFMMHTISTSRPVLYMGCLPDIPASNNLNGHYAIKHGAGVDWCQHCCIDFRAAAVQLWIDR